jgi:predicted nuclease of predicted toxin-antitoxin system
MNLYLDDDCIAPVLVSLLRKAGHDVRLPMDFGLSGSVDPIHLRRAVREQRVFLSANHDDFELLHLLVMEAQGQHPGILIIRKDNDASRDMTPRGVIVAIGKMGASGMEVRNEFIILNHWR